MNANNEKDQINLKNYFDALLEKNKNIDNEALAVLRKLIDLTLSFRDKLKKRLLYGPPILSEVPLKWHHPRYWLPRSCL